MSATDRKNTYYVITRHGMERWYLYSVEQCSFGKRIEWTPEFKSALVFSSEKAVETFKHKNLSNVAVDIHRFLKGEFQFTE